MTIEIYHFDRSTITTIEITFMVDQFFDRDRYLIMHEEGVNINPCLIALDADMIQDTNICPLDFTDT
jgi:hypothetical protein